MKLKKILKIIGIIILILLILVIIHTFRNYIIIRKLQNNFSQYSSSTNFHILSVAKENDNTTVTMNYYQKDNKQVVFMERANDGEKIKLSMYNNGDRVDVFTESNEEKSCNLDAGKDSIQVLLVNYLETDNNWQTLLGCILANVKTTTYKDKECYSVNNFIVPGLMYDKDKNEVILEKETGLYLKSTMGTLETEREYEFDKVDDSIFVEPDISQYKLNK